MSFQAYLDNIRAKTGKTPELSSCPFRGCMISHVEVCRRVLGSTRMFI
jgi:hypothetical protein